VSATTSPRRGVAIEEAPNSLSLAVADGAWAGAQIHRSLVF